MKYSITQEERVALAERKARQAKIQEDAFAVATMAILYGGEIPGPPEGWSIPRWNNALKILRRRIEEDMK